MSDQRFPGGASYGTANRGAVDPAVSAAQVEGVLGRRLFAYVIDLVVIFGIVVLLAIAIFVLGVLTLTFGWWLYALLFPPAVAIGYNALTIGGPAQSTIGMRMMGLRVINAGDARPVDKITAAVHALLFYIAAGTFILWLVDVLIGMARDDRRLGHDLLTGLMLVRNL